jgi:undecaprenyl pyrophosphate phosphatase UppP
MRRFFNRKNFNSSNTEKISSKKANTLILLIRVSILPTVLMGMFFLAWIDSEQRNNFADLAQNVIVFSLGSATERARKELEPK